MGIVDAQADADGAREEDGNGAIRSTLEGCDEGLWLSDTWSSEREKVGTGCTGFEAVALGVVCSSDSLGSSMVGG